MYVGLVLISIIVGKIGSREVSSLLVRAILPGFFCFLFFLVWGRPPSGEHAVGISFR